MGMLGRGTTRYTKGRRLWGCGAVGGVDRSTVTLTVMLWSTLGARLASKAPRKSVVDQNSLMAGLRRLDWRIFARHGQLLDPCDSVAVPEHRMASGQHKWKASSG
jgi:hypothetical protein